MRLLIILTVLPVSSLAIEPVTTGLFALAAAGAGYLYNNLYSGPSKSKESCGFPWVYTWMSPSFEGLHGQPLVSQLLSDTIRKRDNYGKPMSLSFHGPVGTGKTFLSSLISESLFKLGKNSQYVYFFTVGYDFPNPNKVDEYKEKLSSKLFNALADCDSSVFIFDEFDKMPKGIHSAIAPFLEPRGVVNRINTGKAVFIFLSNTGSKVIVQKTYDLWSKGIERTDFKLSDFEEDLKNAVYNEEGSLKESQLIQRELIDAYVPFLPLEKSHVEACIVDEYKKFYHGSPPRETILAILGNIKFSDEMGGLYAESGCKKVASLIARLTL